MLKISKLIASIAIVSSAIIGASAQATLVSCEVKGPSGGTCYSNYIRVKAGNSMNVYGEVFNSGSYAQGYVKVLRGDGTVIFQQGLSKPRDFPSLVNKNLVNSSSVDRSFLVSVQNFTGPVNSSMFASLRHR